MKLNIPCKKISNPADPTMNAPLNVEMAASSLTLPSLSDELGDIERSRRGARSVEPFRTAMTGGIEGVKV